MTQKNDTLTIEHRKSAVFAVIEAAAVAGARCPMNDQLPHSSNLLKSLCLEGHIRIEVFERNWRTATILKGPNAGKTTAPCPIKGAKAYIVVCMDGTLRNGRDANRSKGPAVTLAFKDGKRDREVF